MAILNNVNVIDAYEIEAEFIDPDAIIFPLGDFLPNNLTDPSNMNFRDISAVFHMQIFEDETPSNDSDNVRIIIRMELSGGGPIFTVSSQPFDVREVLIPRGRLTNQQLALIPELHIGEGSQFNANQLFPHIDGGMMREGLYILTVILVDPILNTEDWDFALNSNFGIHSTVIRSQNPSIVELIKPLNYVTIYSNPIFSWNFPRHPGVSFLIEVVSGEEGDDPSIELDFASDQNKFLEKTIELTTGVFGELTNYAYTGTGDARPLNLGETYFWRVTATAPTMFGGDGRKFYSNPFTFNYGEKLPDQVALIDPANGSQLTSIPPVFRWRFPHRPGISFEIGLYTSEGSEWARIFVDGSNTPGDVKSYRYGQGIDDRELVGGDYIWRVTATVIDRGVESYIGSEERGFTYVTTVVPVHEPEPEPKEVEESEIILFIPEDGASITSETPEYRWWTIPEDPVYILSVYDAESDQLYFSQRYNSNTLRKSVYFKDGREGTEWNVQPYDKLKMNHRYRWRITAVFSDGVEYNSDFSAFEYPLSEVILAEVNYAEDSDVPDLSWRVIPPLPSGSEFSFKVEIIDEDGNSMSDDTVETPEWRYSGTELIEGQEYTCKIIARFTLPDGEIQTVESNEMIFRHE